MGALIFSGGQAVPLDFIGELRAPIVLVGGIAVNDAVPQIFLVIAVALGKIPDRTPPGAQPQLPDVLPGGGLDEMEQAKERVNIIEEG